MGPLDAVALTVAGAAVLVALLGPWLAPHDPYAVDLGASLHPPSAQHLLGTDLNGRDVLSRILVGARSTLLATIVVVAASAAIGTVVGVTAALGGRWVDDVLMRVTDIGLALPSLVLALGLAAALGPSLRSAVIALVLTWWPGYARLVRTVVRAQRDADFIQATRSLGAGRARVVLAHLLPNSLSVLSVQTTLDVTAVMLTISGLSFVGVGAQVPSAEWGATIAAAAANTTSAWWAVLFPGLAIAATGISFNLVGDWLRARTDPTLRYRR